jgi:CBS-domain-containing membrane protein
LSPKIESNLQHSGESFYVDSGRKLDNKVQKAQRISAKSIINKKRDKTYKIALEMLPYTDEKEHLFTVIGQNEIRKNFEKYMAAEKLNKRQRMLKAKAQRNQKP